MVQNKSNKKNINEESSEEVPKCAKGGSCHWVIDAPNGPISKGKCKKCGTVKEFKNSIEFSSWYGSKSDFTKIKSTDKSTDKKSTK